MKKLSITITGKTDGDLETGLAEVIKRFEAGNTSGFDSNDTGQFLFSVDGEDEEVDDEDEEDEDEEDEEVDGEDEEVDSPAFSKGDKVKALGRRVESGIIIVKRGDGGTVDSVNLDGYECVITVLFDNGVKIEYLESQANYDIEVVESTSCEHADIIRTDNISTDNFLPFYR